MDMLALGIGPAPIVWLLDCIRGAHLGHGDLKRFATYGQILAPDKVRGSRAGHAIGLGRV